MNIRPICTMLRTTALCGGLVLLATGCNKQADNTMNFTTAINNYYSAHPACLWADPIKFPVQADTSDTSKTSGYDALVDQGLLVRTTAEKKKFIIASKQVTNYDLSDKGRAAWTADVDQPGFGQYVRRGYHPVHDSQRRASALDGVWTAAAVLSSGSRITIGGPGNRSPFSFVLKVTFGREFS